MDYIQQHMDYDCVARCSQFSVRGLRCQQPSRAHALNLQPDSSVRLISGSADPPSDLCKVAWAFPTLERLRADPVYILGATPLTHPGHRTDTPPEHLARSTTALRGFKRPSARAGFRERPLQGWWAPCSGILAEQAGCGAAAAAHFLLSLRVSVHRLRHRHRQDRQLRGRVRETASALFRAPCRVVRLALPYRAFPSFLSSVVASAFQVAKRECAQRITLLDSGLAPVHASQHRRAREPAQRHGQHPSARCPLLPSSDGHRISTEGTQDCVQILGTNHTLAAWNSARA